MKKLLFVFLIAVSITACNNNKTADTPAGASSPSSATEEKDKSSEPAGGCASFFWFKQGSVLEYQTSDATGKVISHATTTVNTVHDDKGALAADVTISYGTKGKDIHATYRCEGDKIYADMKSIFNDLLGSMRKTGMEVEFTNAYLSYPWSMKQGDKLDEAAVEIKTKKDGKEFMNMKRTIKDRTVEGNESVTTPAGTYNCLKITENWTMDMTMMGKAVNSTNQKSVQWFDKRAGVVKTETYDDKGKLQSVSELVSLK